MKAIQIRDIVKAVNGTLLWGKEKKEVTNVVIDSRQAGQGSLFVPLIGERVDAHCFLDDVLLQGATCVFSSRKEEKTEGRRGACIYVEDTLLAMQHLAAWYRSLFTLPVIGITGSVGKTTTKEMIAAVLETKYKTVKTFKNLNSQIGVALMMFELEEDTEMAVFEMGISMPGEMESLVEMVHPTCAVLTNIGVSHIGNLGSRENICREKGKIITYIGKQGRFYVCGNGDLLTLTKKHIPYDRCQEECETVYYGTEGNGIYYGDTIRVGEKGQSFLFHSPACVEEVELSVMGNHNVNNAVVALALAIQYGIDIKKAKEALRRYQPIDMRGVVHEIRGAHLIDDTYNASPDSIKSNLQALFHYPGKGGRIAVLADVLELGERSEELHESIGKYIVEQYEKGNCLSYLVVLGEQSEIIARYVAKYSDIPVYVGKTREDIVEFLLKTIEKDEWILVKGSRGMQMDKVVEQLLIKE